VILRKHLKFLIPHDLTELLDMEGVVDLETDNEANYICPWCQRVEARKMGNEIHLTVDSMEL